MATVFGLTDLGLAIMAFQDVVAAIETGFQAALGASIPLGDRTLLGIIVRIFAEQISNVWDLAQALYASLDPDAATGIGLEAVSAITGTFRPDATKSDVTLTMFGLNGTLIPAGTVARTASTNAPFVTIVDATIATLPAFVGATTYTLGTKVTNSIEALVCVQAGLATAGVLPGGPLGTIITQGATQWKVIATTATASVDVEAVSSDFGPVVGATGDISVIGTAISGWTAVNNLADAVEGSDVGSDSDLRVLREAELSLGGSGTHDALRADILALDTVNILSCTVFHNETDVTDVNGLPPHSIEVLVRTTWAANATKDQPLVDLLGKNFAAGIATYSSVGTFGTFIDSEGNPQTIFFSRPTEVPIFVSVTLKYDATLYPADGDAEVKQAIVTFGNSQLSGKDAVAVGLGAQAFKVAGVIDIPRSGSLGGTLIGIAASPTLDTTIVMSARQLATYDSGHVSVTSSAATP